MSTDTARPPVDVTLHGVCEGYHVEISLRLPIDQLQEACRRLAAAGVQPAPAPSTTNGNGNGKAPQRSKERPLFDEEGAPMCPTHGKPMREGRYGWFCSQKAEGLGSKNGYCSFTVKE